jgi:hypothetical protein
MKKITVKNHYLIFSLLFLTGNCYANQTPHVGQEAIIASLPDQSIEVGAIKNPEWKSYDVLLEGFNAFDSNRNLAPSATLRFALRPIKSDVDMDGVTLKIQGSELSVPIVLDKSYRFSLPRDERFTELSAELVINRKKSLLSIRPDIRTPGLATGTRRLGDLRLECHVRWAIEKNELSFAKRTAFKMLGGPCKSETVSTLYFSDGVIKKAWISAPGRKIQLAIGKDGNFYRPPIHDNTWDDDALITLEYINAQM